MKNIDRRNLELIERVIDSGGNLYLVRIFDEKTHKWKRLVADEQDKPLVEPLSGIADEMIAAKKSADIRDLIQEDLETKAAIEIIRPKLNLIVFGAGHVGQAVALIGAILGYDVTLVDDREEFATRKRIPDSRVHLMVGNYSEVVKELRVSSSSAVVIVTRGHQYDEVCLRGVIRSGAGYLGMIGSKRRTVSVMNQLKSDGFSDVDFSKVHAPIGLPIGAKSPQEIAVAIHAEIVEHFNKSGR